MFVNVSMCLGHLPETLSSLRFASKVQKPGLKPEPKRFLVARGLLGQAGVFLFGIADDHWLNTKDMFQYLGDVLKQYH